MENEWYIMKKIIVVILLCVTAAVVFAFFPISQKSLNSGNGAATPNTYIPRSIMWYNSRDAVYVRDI